MGNKFIVAFDRTIVKGARWVMGPVERIALFIVFFWFGFLKLIDASPANPLVADLLERTLPFWSFESFVVFLGMWEMLIGIAFLLEGWERFAIALLVPHMVTTIMPLILLPGVTWQSFLVPTLEGQYIIKNVVIVALALSIAARLKPFRRS
ncbi:MAG: hypothetical protein A3J54_03020 [Candidatus Ryanbacteria bacterium RIFCSPHIGHO2_02_FULL_45_13b]|uniref:DoxX family protein n=1 Tax=Candidatus Ryanbacteria bacterium RIFCSPHIGHO2_02_FULL_45_13b TaxID=1802117 RepID=A0A1G2G6S6_9BACT|nr:MAG: hypothetical protein A3J54_03020 [Candidatus Ryanbacteria bacterium RIFCSPHIGHO2_02_FULL_45_13b]